MRILHVILDLDSGGAENHLVQLISEQCRNGHEVSVAYLMEGRDFWHDVLEKQNVGIYDLGMKWQKNDGVYKVNYFSLKALLNLRKVIGRIEADMVHAHLPPAEVYVRAALFGMRKRIPLVISRHNNEPYAPFSCAPKLEKLVSSRAGKLIAISNAVKTFFTTSPYSVPEKKMEVIHYGLDLDVYRDCPAEQVSAVRKEFSIPEDTLLVGTVARMVEQKDLPLLLAAFARFRESNKNVRLMLVGEGELETLLRTRCSELKIEDVVTFAGFRRDIPAIMKAFDIFALTSRWEGLGLVLLESMAAGTPVVATRAGAIPEIVADGVNGRLVDVGDCNGVVAAFSELADIEIRTSMGKAGIRRVEEQFSVQAMERKTCAVYKDILEG